MVRMPAVSISTLAFESRASAGTNVKRASTSPAITVVTTAAGMATSSGQPQATANE